MLCLSHLVDDLHLFEERRSTSARSPYALSPYCRTQPVPLSTEHRGAEHSWSPGGRRSGLDTSSLWRHRGLSPPLLRQTSLGMSSECAAATRCPCVSLCRTIDQKGMLPLFPKFSFSSSLLFITNVSCSSITYSSFSSSFPPSSSSSSSVTFSPPAPFSPSSHLRLPPSLSDNEHDDEVL